MHDAIPFARALQAFGVELHVGTVPLGNAGGFSGAELWRVATGERQFALRRWPTSFEESRIRFVHALQEFGAMQVEVVPRLQRTKNGDTLALLDGSHWELATWMPGAADFHQSPTDVRLIAAMQALARLHVAWEYFPTRMTGLSSSPAMKSRGEQLANFRTLVPDLRLRLLQASAELKARGRLVLDYFEQHAAGIEFQLREASQWQVNLQPCLRDVWHDHLLFTGDAVTGIIDFGAARIECVAGDIARLARSLIRGDVSRWSVAIGGYEQVRPLSDVERQLVPVFDRSSVAMSGMQWLEWLLVEGRQFEMPRVLARLDEICMAFQAQSFAP